MALTNVDFCTTHFEIKAPTKINKELDFESLTQLVLKMNGLPNVDYTCYQPSPSIL